MLMKGTAKSKNMSTSEVLRMYLVLFVGACWWPRKRLSRSCHLWISLCQLPHLVWHSLAKMLGAGLDTNTCTLAIEHGAIVGHRAHLITELLIARVTGERFIGDGAPPIWGLSYDLGHTMGGEGHKGKEVLVYARGVIEVEKG